MHNMEKIEKWMVTLMQKALFICRSQTEAFAAYRLLESAGIRGVLTRPPREISTSSCSYAVRVNGEDLTAAQNYLAEKNFLPCKVHMLED